MPHSALRLARLAAVPLLAGCAALHAAFDLTGELPAAVADGPVVVLRESHEARSSTPTANGRITGGRFHLRVEGEPGLYKLELGETQVLFVAGAEQRLRLTAATDADGGGLRIAGGADQDLFAAYETFRAESLARLVTPARVAIARVDPNNAAEIARLTDQEVAGYRDHRRELNDFTIAKLRGSPALYAASLRWDGDYRPAELATVAREFAAAHPTLEIARLMETRVAAFRATALGAMAPALSGPTPDGGTLTLAALRGRVVLVDFWASWCAPCRVENANYAELYRRHRAAGFEILAVSVDQDGRAWRAAIAKDQATWKHLSDLGGWKTPLAARYNVTALPASFLLDREGRIIAKDVRGKSLAALVAEQLKAK